MQAGLRRGGLSLAVLLLGFGVLVPWTKGLSFLEPLMLLAYALLPPVLAGPIAMDLVLASSPRSSSSWRAISRAAGLTWLLGAGLLVLGVITVNLRMRFPELLLPDWPTTALLLAISLAVTLAAAALGVSLLFLTTRPARAKAAWRALFFLILLAFGAATWYGPPDLRDRFSLALLPSSLRRWALWVCGGALVLTGLLAAFPLRRSLPHAPE